MRIFDYFKKKLERVAAATSSQKREHFLLLLVAIGFSIPVLCAIYIVLRLIVYGISLYWEPLILLTGLALVPILNRLYAASANYSWRCGGCTGCPERDIQKIIYLAFRRCAEPIAAVPPATMDSIKAIALSSQHRMPGYWYRIVKKREVADRLELAAVRECLAQTIAIIFQTQAQHFSGNISGVFISDIEEDDFAYTICVTPLCNYTRKYMASCQSSANGAESADTSSDHSEEIYDEVF